MHGPGVLLFRTLRGAVKGGRRPAKRTLEGPGHAWRTMEEKLARASF